MRKTHKITAMIVGITMIMSFSSCKKNETTVSESERPIEIENRLTEINIHRLPLPYFKFEYDAEAESKWSEFLKEEFQIEININNISEMHQNRIITGLYLPEAINDDSLSGLIELSGGYLYSVNRLKDENLILPLDEYLIDNLVYQGLPESIKDSYISPDGQTWALAAQNSFGIYSRIFKTEWLDALNIQTPENLDELYAVSKAFAYDDPNKNGETDEHGMDISIGEGGRNLSDIFIANECYLSNLAFCTIAFNHKTGAYEDALLQPGMKDSLNYIKSMIDEKILHINYNFDFLEQKSCGNFYDILYYFQDSLDLKDWTEVTNLTGGEQKSIMAQRPFKAFVLTSNTQNPKETINAFVNTFLSDIAGMAVGTYGVENVNYKIENDEIEVLTESRVQLTGLNYELLASSGVMVNDTYSSEAFMNYRMEKIEEFNELYASNLIFWDSHSTIMGDRKISRAFGEAMYQWLSSDNLISAADFVDNLLKTAKSNGNSKALNELNLEIGQASKYSYD